MKSIKLFLLMMFSLLNQHLSSLHGQVPPGIPYQAVVRNLDGSILSNSTITLRLSIRENNTNGSIEFQETHALTSNVQGLVSAVVGHGTSTMGSFSIINWSNTTKFLQVEMDLGQGYIELGTQQLMSVPYALYAGSTNVSVSPTGDTLTVGAQSVIVPGISAANPPALFNQGPGVTDIDGNFYPSIIINGQEWMQQNLAVTKYRNGNPIPTGLANGTWQTTSNGAYAIYNNDVANNALYGKLYNWYAIIDNRGVCPAGWHVPSDGEWTQLIEFLDLNQVSDATNDVQSPIAGEEMKSIEGWNIVSNLNTNLSGFSGLPGGYRSLFGDFWDEGTRGYWWTKSISYTNVGWNRMLYNSNPYITRYQTDFPAGLSVRCLKD